MWIVAVAWIYVVGLMAVTEHSIVAGIMTFFGYCVLPLSIMFYLFGGRARRARRDARSGAGNTGPDSSAGSASDSVLYASSGDGSRSGDCSSDSADSGSADSGCSDSGGSDSSSSSD